MRSFPSACSTTADGYPAIRDQDLAGDGPTGRGGQEDRRAGDVVGLADPAERRGLQRAGQALRILPQRAREIGAHQPGRDAVDRDVARPPLYREVAGELEIGRL